MIQQEQSEIYRNKHFARKYALDSILQPLQDLHTFAPLQSQDFSKKSV